MELISKNLSWRHTIIVFLIRMREFYRYISSQLTSIINYFNSLQEQLNFKLKIVELSPLKERIIWGNKDFNSHVFFKADVSDEEITHKTREKPVKTHQQWEYAVDNPGLASNDINFYISYDDEDTKTVKGIYKTVTRAIQLSRELNVILKNEHDKISNLPLIKKKVALSRFAKISGMTIDEWIVASSSLHHHLLNFAHERAVYETLEEDDFYAKIRSVRFMLSQLLDYYQFQLREKRNKIKPVPLKQRLMNQIKNKEIKIRNLIHFLDKIYTS